MKEKTFDNAFLARLALAVKAVERERANPAELGHLETGEQEEAIYIAYEERGGDSAAAKKQLAAAGERCDQAFGRILQFIADQYDSGPIDRAADATLLDLTHDGLDAAERWGEHLEAHDAAVAGESVLRSLLSAHRQSEEAKRNLHDDLLWPLATRIWRED
jgi:hypothetical protein